MFVFHFLSLISFHFNFHLALSLSPFTFFLFIFHSTLFFLIFILSLLFHSHLRACFRQAEVSRFGFLLHQTSGSASVTLLHFRLSFGCLSRRSCIRLVLSRLCWLEFTSTQPSTQTSTHTHTGVDPLLILLSSDSRSPFPLCSTHLTVDRSNCVKLQFAFFFIHYFKQHRLVFVHFHCSLNSIILSASSVQCSKAQFLSFFHFCSSFDTWRLSLSGRPTYHSANSHSLHGNPIISHPDQPTLLLVHFITGNSNKLAVFLSRQAFCHCLFLFRCFRCSLFFVQLRFVSIFSSIFTFFFMRIFVLFRSHSCCRAHPFCYSNSTNPNWSRWPSRPESRVAGTPWATQTWQIKSEAKRRLAQKPILWQKSEFVDLLRSKFDSGSALATCCFHASRPLHYLNRFDGHAFELCRTVEPNDFDKFQCH